MEGFDASILMICWGNICRSPAAEGVMRRLLAERGLEERIHVDSAGTLSYHSGEPPNAQMRKTAAERGYDLRGTARQIVRDDFRDFTYIIAMDRKNLRDLEEIGGRRWENVHLLGEYLSGVEGQDDAPDVVDPYAGQIAGFEAVLDMLEEGLPRLLDEVVASLDS